MGDTGRVSESVIPSLVYSSVCSSTIEVRNLGDRPVDGSVEPHRESGALVPLVDQHGMAFRLSPGQETKFSFRIPESTDTAWVAVRERIPSSGLSPVLSVIGTTDCLNGRELRSAIREVAHASRNPWFDGEIGGMTGARLVVVNVAETMATVIGCYSSGALVGNPNIPGQASLAPLCTHHFREQIPPFGSRKFPVERGANTHFSLRTAGRAIALQMLRLLDAGTQLYQVDTSISFGEGSK